MTKYDLLILPSHLADAVASCPQASHGNFYTGKVYLHDGRVYTAEFDNCMYLFYVEGEDCVPFSIDDIARVEGTNEPIDMAAWRKRAAAIHARGLIDYDGPRERPPASIPQE